MNKEDKRGHFKTDACFTLYMLQLSTMLLLTI